MVVALHGSGSNASQRGRAIASALADAVAGVRGHLRLGAAARPTGISRRTATIRRHDRARSAAAGRHSGLRTNRLGITGQSMGGYGALLLGRRLHRPVAAVAALSPAIYASSGDARAANARAFDSAADFARNDVFTGIAAWRTVPTWVACGTDDPFAPEVATFRAELAAKKARQVPGGLLPGCHDDAFWLSNMPAALQFIGARLS